MPGDPGHLRQEPESPRRDGAVERVVDHRQTEKARDVAEVEQLDGVHRASDVWTSVSRSQSSCDVVPRHPETIGAHPTDELSS